MSKHVEMNMALELLVIFTSEQKDEFCRPIAGTGGGQNFVRRCGAMLLEQNENPGNTRVTWFLKINGSDPEKWFRYRDDYGDGGFQSRLGRKPKQKKLL